MDIGTAVVCVGGLVALSTMVLKFVPGRRNDLNDRVVTMEERVRQHASALDRMDGQFKTINEKLDQLRELFDKRK